MRILLLGILLMLCSNFLFGTKYYLENDGTLNSTSSFMVDIQSDTIKTNEVFKQSDNPATEPKWKKLKKTGVIMTVLSVITTGALFLNAWSKRNDPPGSLDDITLGGVIIGFIVIAIILLGPVLLLISLIWQFIDKGKTKDKVKGRTYTDPVL